MIEFETKIIDVVQRTYNVKSFRVKRNDGLNFKPGQFLSVTINVDSEDITKYLSFSSSPTEKAHIEFTKKLTESAFSKVLAGLKEGDKIKLKMPMGNFIFEGEYPKIAFLSGGIGITPIRSMCKYATDMKLSSDIVLLYGNNKKEDIAFVDDFIQMQEENKNIHVIYTLMCPDEQSERMRCRTGIIDSEMIKKEIIDYSERVFYVCGPPKMVETMINMLKEKLNVPINHIKRENFIGY